MFLTSRRRHTRWPRDWSSDVCSSDLDEIHGERGYQIVLEHADTVELQQRCLRICEIGAEMRLLRSEEHTSELQSRGHLVCRLLLEKKNMQDRRRELQHQQSSSMIQ